MPDRDGTRRTVSRQAIAGSGRPVDHSKDEDCRVAQGENHYDYESYTVTAQEEDDSETF